MIFVLVSRKNYYWKLCDFFLFIQCVDLTSNGVIDKQSFVTLFSRQNRILSRLLSLVNACKYFLFLKSGVTKTWTRLLFKGWDIKPERYKILLQFDLNTILVFCSEFDWKIRIEWNIWFDMEKQNRNDNCYHIETIDSSNVRYSNSEFVITAMSCSRFFFRFAIHQSYAKRSKIETRF